MNTSSTKIKFDEHDKFGPVLNVSFISNRYSRVLLSRRMYRAISLYMFVFVIILSVAGNAVGATCIIPCSVGLSIQLTARLAIPPLPWNPSTNGTSCVG